MTQDLVIVSYGPDITLLRALVSSINRFVPDDLFQHMWLVITDDTPLEEFQFVREGRFRWITLGINDLFLPHNKNLQSGYINQQIAKLMIAQNISSDWYWIFDSKNFIIKPIDENTLYREGRAKVSVDFPSIHWNLGWKACLDHYAIKFSRPIINLTPYPIHAPTMKQLINKCEDLPVEFAKLYEEHNVCEFFFYNGYVQQQGLFEKLYQPEGMLKVTIWPNELNDPSFSPSAIKAMLENPRRDKPIWAGGLHKSSIAQMTDVQKADWAQFLVWLGLFGDDAAVHEWYANVLDK